MKRVVLAGFVLAAGVGLAFAQQAAKADLKDAQGQSVGTVTLTDTPNGVLIHAALTNVPPGVHAFHIHQTGACEAPFTTAGGHFNPAMKQHGMTNPMGMHAGDMPNIEVPAGGKLTFDVLDSGVTLAAGPNSVFDADGSAIVLHAGPDDYKTDPAGNAGARIACGIITR
jgi:Cu-Zn family superoxide dismutase